jgi:hypothetical protein
MMIGYVSNSTSTAFYEHLDSGNRAFHVQWREMSIVPSAHVSGGSNPPTQFQHDANGRIIHEYSAMIHDLNISCYHRDFPHGPS